MTDEPKAWTLKTLEIVNNDKIWNLQTFDTKEAANAALASMNPAMEFIYPTEMQACLDRFAAKRNKGAQ